VTVLVARYGGLLPAQGGAAPARRRLCVRLGTPQPYGLLADAGPPMAGSDSRASTISELAALVAERDLSLARPASSPSWHQSP